MKYGGIMNNVVTVTISKIFVSHEDEVDITVLDSMAKAEFWDESDRKDR